MRRIEIAFGSVLARHPVVIGQWSFRKVGTEQRER